MNLRIPIQKQENRKVIEREQLPSLCTGIYTPVLSHKQIYLNTVSCLCQTFLWFFRVVLTCSLQRALLLNAAQSMQVCPCIDPLQRAVPLPHKSIPTFSSNHAPSLPPFSAGSHIELPHTSCRKHQACLWWGSEPPGSQVGFKDTQVLGAGISDAESPKWHLSPPLFYASSHMTP